MKIYLGADHHGFTLKAQVISYLQRAGHQIIDEGDTVRNPDDDFPQFAAQVCSKILSDKEDCRGILICGSGQGMCMAANRFKGIRASLCWNLSQARLARNDDDSNVLCLPADSFGDQKAEAIITTWLNTPFAGASRYKRRIQALDNLG